MNVGRYDYAEQFGDDLEEVVSAVRKILLRGDYDRSPEGRAFEQTFATYLGARFARAVGCGTDALLLSLRALGIGPGDEVITQANTFYATAAAIVLTGATLVLVDVDDETFNMDAASLEAAITPRTRAIVPVHLYGKPAPMHAILDVAKRHGLLVVEDAAQAHGATLGGRRVGTFGDTGCFSFHPSKNLAAAGDGGCVVTESETVATAIEAHRTHGQLIQHEHVCLGINSKLDAIQATVLLSKLPKLDAWNAQRRATAQRYRESLKDVGVGFQREDPGEEHVYHLFQIRTAHRDELMEHLQSRGVDAVVRYPTPIHLQPPFAHYGWRTGDFPCSERLGRELLCLPMRPGMSEAQEQYVVESVRAFYARVAA